MARLVLVFYGEKRLDKRIAEFQESLDKHLINFKVFDERIGTLENARAFEQGKVPAVTYPFGR